jgi:hypothetical protein
MDRGGENKSGRYLEVEVFAEGGRKKGLFGSLKAVKVGAGLGLRENYGR